ncbi:hypothetical protein EBO33_14205 [[Curtobacterium] plantarum]|nr:hypothetical protein CBF16_16615 [Pantoea agglomerans]RNA75784.1 hypothetical protein EBO33_14205 [[Curtobacterium] plantarum]
MSLSKYTRRLSSCIFVGCVHSPESLTHVSSSGFVLLPPQCNPKSFGYIRMTRSYAWYRN